MNRSNIIAVLLILILNGCATTEYLDRPTPAGNQVPPPISLASPALKEIPREEPRVASAFPSTTIPQQRTLDGTLVEPGINRSVKSEGFDGGCFEKAYTGKGNPRIAIFLNRNLSPEVRQWATKSKIVTAGDGEIAAGKAGGASGAGNQSLYEQHYVEDQGGISLNEKDLWRIENGFTQPFLDQNVHLVDRATIMRLVAAAHPDAENSDRLISPKLIETKSLGQYADVFTELLVERSHEVPVGVVLKAVAKEVNTGRIIASVNTLNWDWDALQEKSKKVVATASGYSFESTRKNIPLDYVADRLAKELMVDLCSIWKASSMNGDESRVYSTHEAKAVKRGPHDEVKKVKTLNGQRETLDVDRIVNAMELGDFHALVIGNNDYRYLKDLRTAGSDARSLSDVLQNKYDFKLNILQDATRNDIIVALNSYRQSLSADDSLLIYYAGHGMFDEDTQVGYWLPIDAKNDNLANWLSNSTLTNMIKAIPAKHIFVISDSCFSGTLVRGITPVRLKNIDDVKYWKRIADKRARVVLTSGGLEPVSDAGSVSGSSHSVFAEALLSVLKENNGLMDSSHLFVRIRQKVILNAEQIPEYADIRMAGHDGGEFIFVNQ